MSLQTSLDDAAILLLKAKGDVFTLTCSCGWSCRESRAWIDHRIRRHFDWPDANANEHVTVAAPADGATGKSNG